MEFEDLPQQTINIVNFWMSELVPTFESFGMQVQDASNLSAQVISNLDNLDMVHENYQKGRSSYMSLEYSDGGWRLHYFDKREQLIEQFDLGRPVINLLPFLYKGMRFCSQAQTVAEKVES